jgi:hypothetical protein
VDVPRTSRGRHRLDEQARELLLIEALAPDDARTRYGQLEDSLCEVDGHCRSILLGLLLVALMGVS